MMMFLKIVFFLIFPLCSANEECSKDKDEICNSSNANLYSKEINTKYSNYLTLINVAKENYVPCNSTKCNCHSSVITDNLKPFKKGISKQSLENVKSKGTKYQIINNRLYRDKNCMFPARCAGIEHFLLKLLPKLPDTELIVNTRDWPQLPKHMGPQGPVFSFSKTRDYHDIMYPAWAFWEGGPAISLYPRGIGRWDKHRALLGKVANNTPWEEKVSKGFFRGSRTNSERDSLVLLSREKPELVDAKYTKNQAWKSEADTLNEPPAAEVPFEEHCKYKYLFNFRGVAASFRFKHVLLCKSLVFHVGDEWVEFFYGALRPWIHYVPLEAGAGKEKIEEVLEFFREYDELGKEIGESGYNVIWNNLRMGDVSCYWLKLLRKYTSLLDYKPQLENDFIEIK